MNFHRAICPFASAPLLPLLLLFASASLFPTVLLHNSSSEEVEVSVVRSTNSSGDTLDGGEIGVTCRGVNWNCDVDWTTHLGGDEWEQRHFEAEENRKGKQKQEEDQWQGKLRTGPLQLYYSHKVNHTDGRLFISALALWEFHSLLGLSDYRVQLLVREQPAAVDGQSPPAPSRLFSIPLVKTSGKRKSVALASAVQQVGLDIRLDALFRFGRSYQLKIALLAPLDEEKTQFRVLARAEKLVKFAELLDDLDTAECPDNMDTLQQNGSSPSAEARLTRRKEMASRWTGSLRSITFFPLHLAINVSFYGAPPSHCIPGYRVQLLLLNALQQEKIVRSDELVPEGTAGSGVYVGSTEFRDLLRNERLKYTVKVVPLERWHGMCVCELERKCGCVQIYSDPFAMLAPTDSGAAVNNSVALLSPPAVLEGGGGNSPSPAAPSSAVPFLLASVFLGLTLLLLSLAFLLLLLRNSRRSNRKRRTLLVFNGSRRGKDEESALVGGKLWPGASRREVQSVLLMNAQPARRNELERFARVLVKNGVRVFYDRWDRANIERNMLHWVNQAVTRADKIVLFFDRRAESLLSDQGHQLDEDLFDRVFCALHQHQQMLQQKTLFVKWDNSASDSRSLGCISETQYLFRRDLKPIFSALHIPVTEEELKDIEQKCSHSKRADNNGGTKSLTVVVPKIAHSMEADAKKREKEELMEEDEKENNGTGRDSEETLLSLGTGTEETAETNNNDTNTTDEGLGTMEQEEQRKDDCEGEQQGATGRGGESLPEGMTADGRTGPREVGQQFDSGVLA